MNKKRILIFADYYLPGYKAGGPIQSIQSICKSLEDTVNIYIVTRDRDIGEDKPYGTIVVNKWYKIDNITVIYKNSSQVNPFSLRKLLLEIKPDVVHVNSIMSVKFSLYPILAIKSLPSLNIKRIISPRGELSDGALLLKKRVKSFYILFLKITFFYGKFTWLATSNKEKFDILNIFNNKANVKRIDNFPNITNFKSQLVRPNPKLKKDLNLVFLSRVAPMKNLIFVIKLMKKIDFNIRLSVYGPLEDDLYYQKCVKLIESLPDNIVVSFLGPVKSSEIYKTLVNYDLFILPTLGENFGQAIWEALASSVPVLISDNTPWKNLESSGVGWDVSLKSIDMFAMCLEEVYSMDEEQHSRIRKKCRDYSLNFVKLNNSMQQLKELYTS